MKFAVLLGILLFVWIFFYSLMEVSGEDYRNAAALAVFNPAARAELNKAMEDGKLTNGEWAVITEGQRAKIDKAQKQASRQALEYVVD